MTRWDFMDKSSLKHDYLIDALHWARVQTAMQGR
jgi:hypothetical protein